MHERALSWYFNPPILHICHTFSVNKINIYIYININVYINTFLLANFCMVYMFSFDSNYCGVKINPLGIKNTELCEQITRFFG